MKLVLFDCDGTLIDSAATIHTCMELAFEEAGYERPPIEKTKSIIGLTLDTAIAQMLERDIDDQINHMVHRYKHHSFLIRAGDDHHEPYYDGILETIDTLRSIDGILIGVVTGKSRRGLNNLLDKHGLNATIIASRTADECPSKPHPAMVLECCNVTGIDAVDTIVIGDAIYDMQMAKSAGARALGVSWGYCDENGLRAAGADHIAHQPKEILPIIGVDTNKGHINA